MEGMEEVEGEEEDTEEVGNILEIKTDADISCATFTIKNEDHTLGNAVRYMLVKNKNVEFAGYTIPHPMDNILNLRIQTMLGPQLKTSEDVYKWTKTILEEPQCAEALKMRGIDGAALSRIGFEELLELGFTETMAQDFLNAYKLIKPMPATEALKQSLDNLTQLGEHIMNTFQIATLKFESQ